MSPHLANKGEEIGIIGVHLTTAPHVRRPKAEALSSRGLGTREVFNHQSTESIRPREKKAKGFESENEKKKGGNSDTNQQFLRFQPSSVKGVYGYSHRTRLIGHSIAHSNQGQVVFLISLGTPTCCITFSVSWTTKLRRLSLGKRRANSQWILQTKYSTCCWNPHHQASSCSKTTHSEGSAGSWSSSPQSSSFIFMEMLRWQRELFQGPFECETSQLLSSKMTCWNTWDMARLIHMWYVYSLSILCSCSSLISFEINYQHVYSNTTGLQFIK